MVSAIALNQHFWFLIGLVGDYFTTARVWSILSPMWQALLVTHQQSNVQEVTHKSGQENKTYVPDQHGKKRD